MGDVHDSRARDDVHPRTHGRVGQAQVGHHDVDELGAPATAGSGARVIVVGAGVGGLLAARRLREAGHDVVVLEASDHVGGQVRTVPIAGRPVDVGAEAVHLQVPAAAALVAELGLADDLVGARPNPSFLMTPHGRAPLPAGVGPAGPTRLRPVLRSGILSVPQLVRAGLEPVLASRAGRLSDPEGADDVSVGDFVSARFGRAVSAAFVDPLLGGLHSGDVDLLSLRACTPSLVPAATRGTSLVRARRAARPTPGPSGRSPAGPGITFGSWPQGLTRLVETLAAGTTVRTRTPVVAIEHTRSGYVVTTGDPGDAPSTGPSARDATGGGSRSLRADAVVLAVPAPIAARLLVGRVPAAARALAQTVQAATAAVVLGYPRRAVAGVPALSANGLLVPSSLGTLLKAVTHLSTKWPHLDDPDTYLLRVSAGRAGLPGHGPDLAALTDDELVARLRTDLARLEGVTALPEHVHVQRWSAGIPQLRVGHVDRLRQARAALRQTWPGVALAGASYDGIGLTSCLASGQRAADEIAARLAPEQTASRETEDRT